ncbi:MAG: sulfurtransferase-like selenium metabolism protein YedF [Marinilabiliaceae bacterium]
MAKKALNEVSPGEKIQILSDNETSYENLMCFLTDIGASPSAEKKEGMYHIDAIRSEDQLSEEEEPDAESYCMVPGQSHGHSSYVVVARSNKMGEGDDELGALLIRGYFNALKAMDDLPAHILLFNSGVWLTLKDSDTAEALGELEDRGVSIIVCGTCVDYYQIKDKIGVGRVSNMYQIAGIMAGSARLVFL